MAPDASEMRPHPDTVAIVPAKVPAVAKAKLAGCTNAFKVTSGVGMIRIAMSLFKFDGLYEAWRRYPLVGTVRRCWLASAAVN